ncbi:MAG: single-stranded-DNA-specific exonuclease RecJ, partial [Acidobacteria bacterium]
MQKRWSIRKYDDEIRRKICELSKILNIKPLTAALLINRGIDEEEKAKTFLCPKIDDLHDPFLMKDVDKATARILEAVSRKEKVLIWGDYDVDGTTGTVLLRRALRCLGLDVDFHIPHRVYEGYGIRRDRLEQIKKDGYTLVISTDTGSTALEAGQWASENGLDLIVTDHHKLDKDQERPFFALVNPNQHDCPYPNKHLAGVGVAFKVAQAVLSRANYAQKSKVISELLELTALGTIADIMELAGENRTIV